MGLLTEYFLAPGDAAAAAVAPTHGPASRGLPTVDAYGIEPFVQLGTLEEILTGRAYEQIAAAQPDPVASIDDGMVLVTRLTDTVVTALADLGDDRVPEVAARWAAEEEFGGATDPAALADLLRALRELARTRGEGALYCWLSV